MLNKELFINKKKASFYDYEIGQSLLFDGTSHLYRTPTVNGNLTKWTFSEWVRILPSIDLTLFSVGNSTGAFDYLRISGSRLIFGSWYDATSLHRFRLYSTQLLRDTGWYHIMIEYDSNNAVSTERIRMYINGIRINIFDIVLYPDQDLNSYTNQTLKNWFGREPAGQALRGNVTQAYFLDGINADPSSFGEFKNTIWTPKDYIGSYGTNGFHLDFSNGADIGNDLSGNNNDFINSGFVSPDVVLDSPTNEYAILDSNNKAPGITLSEGGTVLTASAQLPKLVTSTLALPKSGKFYFEGQYNTTSATGYGQYFGLRRPDLNIPGTGYGAAGSWQIYSGGATALWANGSNIGAVVKIYAGEVFKLAIDVDAGKAWLGRGATAWYTSTGVYGGNPVTGENPTFTMDCAGLLPFMGFEVNGSRTGKINFGQFGFAYSPPTGYKAICKANFPEPIDVDMDKASLINLATGNGTTRSITGLKWNPSVNDTLCLTKRRNAVQHWVLYDSLRGPTKEIVTSANIAETTVAQGVTAFNSDNIVMGSNANLNFDTGTYVDYILNMNPAYGMDIVTYTGTGANRTLAHNLGGVPEMIWVKHLDEIDSWTCGDSYQYASSPWTRVIWLNLTNGSTSSPSSFNSSAPTASVFSLGTDAGVNKLNGTYVAYLFRSIPGISKVGFYIGNGLADGRFVHLGFRPKLFIVKRADSTGAWNIWDHKRMGYNFQNNDLAINTTAIEQTTSIFDMLAQGIKLRHATASNVSSARYIYFALAEYPGKYSLGR